MLFAAIELVSSRGRSLATQRAAPRARAARGARHAVRPRSTRRDYYRLLLLDPPFAGPGDGVAAERPDWNTLVFYVLAAIALALVVWGRRRLTRLRPRDPRAHVRGRGPRDPRHPLVRARVHGATAGRARTRAGGPAGARSRPPQPRSRARRRRLVALAVVIALARDESWYERSWPNGALESVRAASASAGHARVRHRPPRRLAALEAPRAPRARRVRRAVRDLRAESLRPLGEYHAEQGADWKSIADGYDVVVVDEQGVSHTDDFLAEPGARKLWGDDRVTVVLRPASS